MPRKSAIIALFLLILLALEGCVKPDGSLGDNPAASSAGGSPAKTVKITIGYQSPTAQTWGALIMKDKKIFEKYLKEAEPDTSFDVEWFDASAGTVLNNNMIGGKIQLAFMGDMPLLLNGVKGLTQSNYHSVFLAFDGKGVMGRNQAIIVPKESGIKDIKDLAGHTVSTPIGSSAHRMLLDALRLNGLLDKVKIVDQGVTVGMQSIEQNKIAAHATWEPYPGLAVQKGAGKILYDGAQTNIDYLDGIVANQDWVQGNKAYTIAFMKALIESHAFIVKSPDEAAQIFERESGFPLEVCKEMTKSIRFDAAVYDRDLKTLEGSIAFLRSLGKLEEDLDLKTFINTTYLEEAAASLKRPYLTEEQRKSDYIAGMEY
ncbi:ABC transporter substrate-binding protein [Paenibacillus sp. sptzw28]|uniref:ABC transporter substrate-binding protein n=1 Tax=Paenibacillus sp. sptzw28 TaxID=715179 RepID=UPI001C6DEC7C|nr:ABC transporter substrate-binding protein [Paenibacillus sp. sptzw28]QYR21458.1 ABC transporter substrate-binding protein [Paenibacillus sp. sptzw28]